MLIGKLILALGVQAENPELISQFEQASDKAAGAAEKAAKASNESAKGATAVTTASKKAGSQVDIFGWNLTKLDKGIKSADRSFHHFKSIIIGAYGALTAVSVLTSKIALNLTRFELNTGLSSQQLQRWQQQAALSGVSADEVSQSVQQLQQSMAEIRVGGGDVTPFARLGLSINEQDPFAVLNELSKRLKEMPAAFGTTFAKQLGLSDNMIAFLREMHSNAPSDRSLLLTPGEVRRMKDFNVYFNRVWDNIQRMVQKIGVVGSPLAKGVLGGTEKLVKDIYRFAQFIDRYSPNVKKFSGWLALLAGAIVAWLSPAAAVVIGLVLAFDDLMAYTSGGDSAIGRVVGHFEDWRNVLRDIVVLIGVIIDLVTGPFQMIWMGKIVDLVKDLKNGKFRAPKDMLGEKFSAAIFDDLEKLHPGLFGSGDSSVGYIDQKTKTLKFRMEGSNVGKGGDQTLNQTINVNGARDPREVAEKVYGINRKIFDNPGQPVYRYNMQPVPEGSNK
jgi:hypothetical protein